MTKDSTEVRNKTAWAAAADSSRVATLVIPDEQIPWNDVAGLPSALVVDDGGRAD